MEGVADEMGGVLRRTAYSPNIKEREDCSAAVFGPDGATRRAGRAHPRPSRLDAGVGRRRDRRLPGARRPGDQVLLNDPFAGGTHLNDLTLVATGVRRATALLGYVANRAHHTDVGGIAPGSIPAGATDIAQEGVRIAPVAAVPRRTTWSTRRSDSCSRRVAHAGRTRGRSPRAGRCERARCGAARRARRPVRDPTSCSRRSARSPTTRRRACEPRCASSRRGEWSFTDHLDDDGAGTGPIAIRCTLRIADDGVVVDLTDSDARCAGSVNAVEAVAVSAACFVLRCLVPADIPVNAGCFRPLRVVTRPGIGRVCAWRRPRSVPGTSRRRSGSATRSSVRSRKRFPISSARRVRGR